jgi:hypothetical protein
MSFGRARCGAVVVISQRGVEGARRVEGALNQAGAASVLLQKHFPSVHTLSQEAEGKQCRVTKPRPGRGNISGRHHLKRERPVDSGCLKTRKAPTIGPWCSQGARTEKAAPLSHRPWGLHAPGGRQLSRDRRRPCSHGGGAGPMCGCRTGKAAAVGSFVPSETRLRALRSSGVLDGLAVRMVRAPAPRSF